MNKTISEQLAEYYLEVEKRRQEHASAAMINSKTQERKDKEAAEKREEWRKKNEAMQKYATPNLPGGLQENSWEDQWKK